jgi:predicted nucleic acid-binding protein
MLIPDVNVLVYAREETHGHERYASWLKALAGGSEPFALSEPVLHGFIRVATNPRIFDPPSTLTQVFKFLDALLERPNCTMIRPGGGTLDDFPSALRGRETDFVRFKPMLRWIHL